MGRSIYFDFGTKNEQRILEDIVIESIQQRGQNFFYIPRKLVAKDEILGEDRLSQFKQAFGIEMYLESVDGFDGQDSFMSKFGLQIEQSATVTVAKRTWEKCVGRYGATILPDRPCEGDLIYFPMTDTLFDIKFVKYQDPFYQLGKTYVYKLRIETFQYSSEHIDTGHAAIDAFESLKSYDSNPLHSEFGRITAVQIVDGGSGYATAPLVTVYGDGIGAEIEAVLGTGANSDKVVQLIIKDSGYGYNTPPEIEFEEPEAVDGEVAEAIVTQITVDTSLSQSYGDNVRFKKEASDILFSEDNPFGELE
jgi:hypothetical protein